MRRTSDTEVFVHTTPLTMGTGRSPNVGLTSIIFKLSSAGAGNVVIKLTRGAVVSVLATIPMTGETSGAVYFDAPVVLTDADILSIDASGAGVGGTAFVNTEQE